MIVRKVVLLILLWIMGATSVLAQQGGTGRIDQAQAYKQFENLLSKLEQEVQNISFDVDRIATYQISFDSTLFTRQGIRFIRYELERVFIEKGGISVLSLEEFKSRNVLHIVGSDSSLTLRNTSLSPARNNQSERLLRLSREYGIDAFLRGHVYYREALGYVISLELFNPASRAIVWSKSLISKTIEQEKPDDGKKYLISAGITQLRTGDYLINNVAYTGDLLKLDYSLRVAFRQPINERNEGYIGLQAGYHYYSLQQLGDKQPNFEPITSSVFETASLFYKTWAEKEGKNGEYWVEIFMGPKILFISNSQNTVALHQGINVNVSENLGMGLDAQYLLTESTTLENGDGSLNLELNSIGYGVKILLRF